MPLIRFFTFLTLLFAGCSDIYTKVYDKELAKKPISCINIKSDNLIIENIVKENPFIKKIYKKSCPFTLKITSNYITSCSSLNAKALGSDFDGFVRFEVLKGVHLIYRNQRDFKGEFNENVAGSLINKMRRDLKFEY